MSPLLSILSRKRVFTAFIAAASMPVLAGAMAAGLDGAPPADASRAAPEQVATLQLQPAMEKATRSVGARQHTYGEHPGVIQWQRWQAHSQPLDANLFIVQPPASTRWAAASGQ